MTAATRLLDRLDARDRGILVRWSLRDEAGPLTRWSWIAITHLGNAPVSIGAALIPLAVPGGPHAASRRAALALAISHVIVQLVKRRVGRRRPMRAALIACPDRFSFPSGHATAALAVGLSYGFAFPALAGPLVALGLLVGFSRVVLRVHYPGDVLVGQVIAVATVMAIRIA